MIAEKQATAAPAGGLVLLSRTDERDRLQNGIHQRSIDMATSAMPKPEVFTRKASGLVRVMSPYSAFVYNILTMGLIFPWTYLWAPGALPGGKLVWGILLAMVLEIPIAFAYVWLSTALPRSGGDYVF